MHNQCSNILNSIANANLIITPNSINMIKRYRYMDNKQYITHRWGVNEIKSLVFNLNPIKKIFISGCISNFYPLRIIARKQDKKLIEVLTHPSYKKLAHRIIGDNYIFELNKYLCCFCDGTSLNVILKKIYEILYSGSLLLSDLNIKNDLEEIGVIENVHCILCDKNNIKNKMNYILNEENIKEINDIRKNCFELEKTFTLDIHCNNINNSLKTYITTI